LSAILAAAGDGPNVAKAEKSATSTQAMAIRRKRTSIVAPTACSLRSDQGKHLALILDRVDHGFESGTDGALAITEPNTETGMTDYQLDQVEGPQHHPAAVARLTGPPKLAYRLSAKHYGVKALTPLNSSVWPRAWSVVCAVLSV